MSHMSGASVIPRHKAAENEARASFSPQPTVLSEKLMDVVSSRLQTDTETVASRLNTLSISRATDASKAIKMSYRSAILTHKTFCCYITFKNH